MSIFDGLSALVNGTNKSKQAEGVLDQVPELSLDMKDEELVKLAEDWEKKYSTYEGKIKKLQEENENYWLGNHFKGQDSGRPMMDNIIYEAVETYRALATKKNPDPFVRGDNSPEGQQLAKDVQNMLVYHADRLRLKIQLKTVILHKELYLLGYVKHSFDEVENDITSKPRRPQNLILEPTAYIDEQMEYTGKYIGERMQDTASELIQRFPNQKEYITQKVEGKMGTLLNYTEWWACNPSEYVFWKLDKQILGKAKNPHWNYAEDITNTDEYGVQTPGTNQALNHFTAPKAPYTFLSTLNLGQQPHDKTSNVGQNLANQDVINKRNLQIDRNADSMNGGLVVSGERSGLTKDQATDVTEALRSGGTVWIPSGAANEAVYRDQAPALPPDIFQQLADKRESLRNIYGVRGSSPSGTVNEKTATGKTLIREQDADRIGGGVTEYLEQFADHVFNWWTQLMYVYYDQPHTASILGMEKALEYVSLQKSQFTTKLTVSVKEGSLIPDSDVDNANQAIELSNQQMLDPITLFDKLGFPDPKGSAERLYMWRTAPELLFPEVGPQVQQSQAQLAQASAPTQAPKAPSESMNYADTPPSVQRQIEAQAGLTPATPQESAIQQATAVQAAQPKPAPTVKK